MIPERQHLRRLNEVWAPSPIYFITTCTNGRAARLATREFHAIAEEVWRNCTTNYGWSIGRYVIMPDHVHFFAAEARGTKRLSDFVGKWKEWTAKYAARRLGYAMPLWQPEFFDHVLRASESYDQKWQYVRENPVRAGLVLAPDDWTYQGGLADLRFD